LFQALRILSQILFFCLFILLLLQTHFSGNDYIGPVEGFFHFDPLLGLTTLIASREFFKPFFWALVPVVLTLLFGRYLCGWVCPLGALLQFFSFAFKKMKLHVPKPGGSPHLFLKYAILSGLLVSSIFTLDLVGFLDPLSLLYRSFIITILPAFAITSDKALSFLPGLGLTSIHDSTLLMLQNLTINRTFHQALLIGAIFLGIILLNLFRERFWCRYLCPAGALLGLLARWNLVKVRVDEKKCIQCKACTLHCQTQANPYPNGDWKAGECIYCYSCASRCPTAAIDIPVKTTLSPSKPICLERRKWIFSAMLGIAAVPLFRISNSAKRLSEKLIRPPGALPEPQFIALCIKCGECMKVCPTNALQPATSQAEPEGLWTPVLVPRIGYCEYYCSLCTQVCPTGAIKELKIKEKTKVRIGSAWINKNRCIPYALGDPCSVCEEQCPTSPKAIQLVETQVMLSDGSWGAQEVPVVNFDICIGCGICETKCPVYDEPAIYCTSLGETRSLQSGIFQDRLNDNRN
jgi:MauM/NapG family ferredoxin protein